MRERAIHLSLDIGASDNVADCSESRRDHTRKPEVYAVFNEGDLDKLKKIDKDADYAMYCALKEKWQITPAVSDLYQASLTVLEMHARAARWIGAGSSSTDCLRPCGTCGEVEGSARGSLART